MKPKIDCKHVWHQGGQARGISLTEPEFQDDVCVFLYCPKCLETMTLIYRINKERTHTDADDAIIEHINKQDATKQKLLRMQMEAEELQERITKNLTKLNYPPLRITEIISSLTMGETLLPDLTALLPEEHRPMAKMIVTGDLVSP